MRKWEDIVKERLEGYESALPAGSFADFRARRAESGILGDAGEDVAQAFAMPSGSAGHLPAKRSALPWALAAAVAAVSAEQPDEEEAFAEAEAPEEASVEDDYDDADEAPDDFEDDAGGEDEE